LLFTVWGEGKEAYRDMLEMRINDLLMEYSFSAIKEHKERNEKIINIISLVLNAVVRNVNPKVGRIQLKQSLILKIAAFLNWFFYYLLFLLMRGFCELHLDQQIYPLYAALYAISIRRTKDLPPASFRFHPTMNTLALRERY